MLKRLFNFQIIGKAKRKRLLLISFASSKACANFVLLVDGVKYSGSKPNAILQILSNVKPRSASTKRSDECWASSGGGIVTEQNHRQPSSSPVRASAAPPSPSSSNASIRKKIKANGGGSGGTTKFRPPKSSSKSSSSVQDEIEIEIAEVLYGMMRQPQSQVSPSKQEMNDSMKMDSRSI
ncbi:hypothetical protein P8452_66667 [Trifolium repens]|nr:hypothetical protein P8452_66667 [Trifolium repens]